ncbi:Retrovirus-related Pol polyprotein [Labeo rohita]|uniref:Retrovirus-related Pol polyprotein n=1 Tax=Labeo rohita TaxID=84645 RepID=A0ABQ8LAP1_LABRO|nr:Retrovirus-related Pol polyprotein [Labeo rohita]
MKPEKLGCAQGFTHLVKVHADVKPVQQKLHRLPFAIREAVSQELKQFVQLDVIEPIESSEWVSPIVVTKQKNKGKIQLCVDLREPNRAIVVDSFPLPHMEEMFAELRGLTGVQCYLDNIIVSGKTSEEHDKNLDVTLPCLETTGLKLNFDICQIRQMDQMSFLGHTISAKGLQPDVSHVQAVLHAPPPKDITSLRSFLGLTVWYSKFIPDYSAVVEPLRAQCRGSASFTWTPEAQTSFDRVKDLIINSPALALFDPELHTIVTTDASNHGLGAVLTQMHPDGSEKNYCFCVTYIDTSRIQVLHNREGSIRMFVGNGKMENLPVGATFYVAHRPQPPHSTAHLKGTWTGRTSDCSVSSGPVLEDDVEVVALTSTLMAISADEFKVAGAACPIYCELVDLLMTKWPKSVQPVSVAQPERQVRVRRAPAWTRDYVMN